jgi:hypothetical protein
VLKGEWQKIKKKTVRSRGSKKNSKNNIKTLTFFFLGQLSVFVDYFEEFQMNIKVRKRNFRHLINSQESLYHFPSRYNNYEHVQWLRWHFSSPIRIWHGYFATFALFLNEVQSTRVQYEAFSLFLFAYIHNLCASSPRWRFNLELLYVICYIRYQQNL